MAVFRFTHGYDAIHQIASIVGGFAVAALSAELVGPLSQPLEDLLIFRDLEWIWGLLTIAYAFSAFFGSIVLLNHTVLPPWLPTLLYLRTVVFVKVRHDEADRLTFLLDGCLGGTWYPLGFLRKIDSDFRREALLTFANRVAAHHQLRAPFPDLAAQKPQQQRTRQQTTREDAEKRQSTVEDLEHRQLLDNLAVLGIIGKP